MSRTDGVFLIEQIRKAGYNGQILMFLPGFVCLVTSRSFKQQC